jgi:hypothetical protein
MENDEAFEELAHRLYVAFTSCQSGRAYSTVDRETRARGAKLGPYWYKLAENVTKDMANYFMQLVFPNSPPG